MKRWLAVYDQESGITQVNNVGVVDADTPNEAYNKAIHAFRTTRGAKILLFDLADVKDGWSYYL